MSLSDSAALQRIRERKEARKLGQPTGISLSMSSIAKVGPNKEEVSLENEDLEADVESIVNALPAAPAPPKQRNGPSSVVVANMSSSNISSNNTLSVRAVSPRVSRDELEETPQEAAPLSPSTQARKGPMLRGRKKENIFFLFFHFLKGPSSTTMAARSLKTGSAPATMRYSLFEKFFFHSDSWDTPFQVLLLFE